MDSLRNMRTGYMAIRTEQRPFNFDKTDAVTLVVGPEKYEMVVHGNVVADKSEFFKMALKKDWREGQLRTIDFPTDDPTTMRDYINFLYNQHLPTAHVEIPNVDRMDHHHRLGELYILADRLLDSTCTKAVIEEMIEIVYYTRDGAPGRLPGQHTIDALYASTQEESPMRRLLVDMYLCYGDERNLEPPPNQSFVSDLIQAMFKNVKDGEYPKKQRGAKLRAADYFD